MPATSSKQPASCDETGGSDDSYVIVQYPSDHSATAMTCSQNKSNAKNDHVEDDKDDDDEGRERPSWISELHAAWDEEIEHNMPEHKRQYFFQYPDSSSSEDDEAEEGKNRKIRKVCTIFVLLIYILATLTTDRIFSFVSLLFPFYST